MKTITIVFILTCFLFLFGFTASAIACCDPPPCGPCSECIDDVCTWVCDIGERCCAGSCCSGTCCDGHCCPPGLSCCGRLCYDQSTQRCCIDPFYHYYICGIEQNCCGSLCYDPDVKKCCPDADPYYPCGSDETCCQGNCCEPDCEFCCDDKCCDKTNCEICKNGSCVRTVPTNMRQTYVKDLGNGILYFKYKWDSTTGDLADLGHCSVREKVDYPGDNPYYWPSPPWVGSSPNPTILPNPPIPGTHGALQDTHSPPGFTTPYQNASVTATQVYQYHCGPACCMEDGEYVTLLDIGSILRVVSGEDDLWRYSIIKSGAYAEIFPLP